VGCQTFKERLRGYVLAVPRSLQSTTD